MRRVLVALLLVTVAPLLAPVSANAATASPSLTRLTVHVAGCDPCKIRLVQALSGPGGATVWHSRRKRIGRDGVVAYTVPRHRTHGMSFELQVPWEGNVGSVPNVVTRYRGQHVGQWWSAKKARASKHAEGCWAGTRHAHATLRFRVLRIAAKDVFGNPTHAAVAWFGRGLRSWRPMTTTWHGRIGNQDAFYCHRP